MALEISDLYLEKYVYPLVTATHAEQLLVAQL
jgi:hypothetical protein